MTTYILRRILLMIPTLLGIMVLNFIIVQAAPGGPVERMVAQLTDMTSAHDASSRLSGSGSDMGGRDAGLMHRPADSISTQSRGLDPEIIKDIEKMSRYQNAARDSRPVARETTIKVSVAQTRRVIASGWTTAFMKLYCGMNRQRPATPNAAPGSPSANAAMR